jgi:hypothetical protein
LRCAESHEVEQVGIDANEATANPLVEVGVDTRSTTEHAVHQLARPTPIACVEARRQAVECRIEQLTVPEVGANLRRRDTGIGDGARAVNGNAPDDR